MKRTGGSRPALFLAAVLALLAASVIASLVPARVGLDLGGERHRALDPRLERALANVEGELVLAWFGTEASDLPAGWRDVPAAVDELMHVVAAAVGSRARCVRFVPVTDEQAARYAARLGVRPHTVRMVRDDGWTETQVWSALRIVDGARGAAIVPVVTPELLPRLQELLAAELEALRAPIRPRIAVAAPESFFALRAQLGERCAVFELDFDTTAAIPEDADLLLWIEPRAATSAHALALERFLARGGSVWIAGPERGVESSNAFGALLPHFGLAASAGVVFVERGGAVAARVASIGEHQDFRALAAEPGGTLFFRGASALEPDAARLAELGYAFRALACSGASSFTEERGPPAKRARAGAQVLCALLEPADPWRGALCVCGSSSPLRDDELADPRAAHAGLVDALFAELASTARVVRRSVSRTAPPAPPELAPGARLLARLLVALLPASAAAFLALRAARRPHGARPMALLLAPAACAALAVLMLRSVPNGAALDLTREREHALPAVFERIARGAEERSTTVHLTAVVSADAELPPELRGALRGVLERATATAALTRHFELRVHRPAADAEPPLDALELAAGAPPRLCATSTLDERTEVRRIRASVYVASAARAERIDLATPRDADAFDARLAAALERTLGRPRRVVAFAAGEERLSPAEARLEFERHGRFAPRPGARFELAREALVRHGFEVVDVDPERPVLPPDCAALVVLGPRRDARALGIELARLLERGGAAFVALQPLRLRPVRRREHSNALAFWPEPQFPDLDEHWLPRLGVAFPRTLVADARSGSLALDVKHEHADGRATLVRERVASPVIVRAAPTEAAYDALAARALPELVLALPARIELDRVELARRGLSATPLYASSPNAWELDWNGGDLEPAALEPLGPGERRALDRAPFAVLLRGAFPAPDAEPAWKAEPSARTTVASAGRLVVAASSECFANDALAEDAAAERVLVQSLAAMLLPRDQAELGARRPTPAGLEPLTTGTRNGSRLALAFGVPLAVLLLALLHFARRRSERAHFTKAAS
ncbi:MAG: Gldg family protein [Planctomycetes bacterium]|nr:Gldg family protein [Planctomycetota bacterium]